MPAKGLRRIEPPVPHHCAGVRGCGGGRARWHSNAGVAVRNEFNWDTTWGRFTIHAYRLSDPRERQADQVGVLVRRAEPRMLALVRGLGVSPPQQREVALLLAHGKTNREIAESLGLSFNTANYHVKQVYARLEVKLRSEVEGKLLVSAAIGPH